MDTQTSIDLGGTGGSFDGTQTVSKDILGGKRRMYPNGKLCSYIKQDGSGTVYYPDGRIAINIIAGDGIPPGLYTTLFKMKGKKDVIGSWDAVGVGSCMYKSGKVCLTTTAQGGSYYAETGECIAMWTWEKRPLQEPIEVILNDCITLTVKDRANIQARFLCQEQKIVLEVGKVMRRSDTYLTKVIGTGTGNERGKLFLDVDKCREALAKTQVLRDSFKASKVDPNMPKEGAIDPRVVELANNPSKVTTDSIRNQIHVINSISTENAGALHALPYIEHILDEQGHRRPAPTSGPDPLSQSFKLQKQMTNGWKCVPPRAHPDTAPKRAPVLMGGRFETCTRFTPYYTQKIRLQTLRSSEYDSFLSSAPKTQAVLVVCVSAASPLATSRVLALAEDVHGVLWERYGDMDMTTRKCAKKPEQLPYRLVSFDVAESRLLAERYNLRSVPMFLIYYAGRLVYASHTFTTQYNAKLDDHHQKVDRMYEAIHKKAFGLTTDDVIRTLEQAKGDGKAGKFLPDTIRFGVSAGGLNDAVQLAKIKPFPSPTIANAKKKPLLKSVIVEPSAVDGIEKRLNQVFGRSGRVGAS